MKKIFSLAILTIVLFGLNACSGSMSMQSTFNKDQITIDGQSTDWQGNLYKLDKTNIGVGIKNDSENIYVCLVSGDRMTNRQIMMNGLYVWFDEKGNSKKRIGIKYPIGNTPPDFRQIQKTRQQRFDENQLSMLIKPEFEFYVGEDDKVIFPNHENEKNIDLELTNDQDQMVYEMKIPYSAILQSVTPEAIKKIGIGVEIGEMERPAMSGGRGDFNGAPPGGMGGGRPGGGMGMDGGPGGGRGRGMQQMNESSSNKIKQWMKVDLSQE